MLLLPQGEKRKAREKRVLQAWAMGREKLSVEEKNVTGSLGAGPEKDRECVLLLLLMQRYKQIDCLNEGTSRIKA